MAAELDLKPEFPPVTTTEWEAVIHADLAGGDYQKKLVWRTPENIAVKPYFRSEDLPVGVAPVEGRGNDWHISEPGAEPVNAIRADVFHNDGATAVQELAF